jgi:hypothetical protein
MVVLAVVADPRNGVLVVRGCNIGRFPVLGAACFSAKLQEGVANQHLTMETLPVVIEPEPVLE